MPGAVKYWFDIQREQYILISTLKGKHNDIQDKHNTRYNIGTNIRTHKDWTGTADKNRDIHNIIRQRKQMERLESHLGVSRS